MNKKTIHLACLALLLICALIAPAAAGAGTPSASWSAWATDNSVSGAGTEASPYIITTVEQLEDFSATVNSIGGTSGLYWILGNDIDLDGSVSNQWIPVGTSTHNFQGTFDGDGYIIDNLYISTTSTYQGLFAHTNTGAVICHLGLENVYVQAGAFAAILITEAYNTEIYECYAIGSVTGSGNPAGGLLGNMYNINMHDCWIDIDLTGVRNNGLLGSIFGEGTSSNIIANCYALGTCDYSTTTYAGGLVGYGATLGSGTISCCVALQDSITVNVARVSNNNGIRFGNYANANMLIAGSTITSTDPTSMNGADVTPSEWATQTWWETHPDWSFDESSAWYWDDTDNLPKLRAFLQSLQIISISADPLAGTTITPITLDATITTDGDPLNLTYQWQSSSDSGSTWANISGATTLPYDWTISTNGVYYARLLATNDYETATSSSVGPIYISPAPDTITSQTPNITTEPDETYLARIQFNLPDTPKKIIFTDTKTAYIATGNAVYKIDCETLNITPVSTTTGNTIRNAYLGATNAIITDIDNTTYVYNYATGAKTYIGSDNTGIIAVTGSYAAIVNNSGYLNIYTTTGSLINSTTTTITNITGNDETNCFLAWPGATINDTYYILKPSLSDVTITPMQITYPSSIPIVESEQILGTNTFFITTYSAIYTQSSLNIHTLVSNIAVLHPQSTEIGTFIGSIRNAENTIRFLSNGQVIGTYTTGATINDASIARITGLWAVAGGDDMQAYFFSKDATSTWIIEQATPLPIPVTHTEMSTSGKYALVATGSTLYLFENAGAPTTIYSLMGIVISSSGSPYANSVISINGNTVVTDAAGKFHTYVTPGITYTITADTTTIQYTASNLVLQNVAIQLKPNPYATAITYAAAYNSTSGNIEMTYGDTTGKTESVTWSIYDTVNKTTVYTHTGTLGTETYPISIEESYKNYQVTVTADRGDTSVKNTWTITPSGSSPINLFGLDDTGKNLIFCTVLMIFGGLFGVMHSTKGALAVSALAAWMRYMELITIPWILISIAAVIAIIASLQRGGEGKV